MAPKALIFLPLFAPFTFAWGSTHDLYVRDAIPEPNPYAYEEALAARAIAARKVYAAKARRAANGRVVLSRQVNARSAKANANTEAHAFQQYDAGLFRRDGSVIPRDPLPFAGASAISQPDPEMWFQGGELYARSHDHDDNWEDEEDEKPRKKTGKKAKKTPGKKVGRKNKNQKDAKKAKKEGNPSKGEDDVDKSVEKDDGEEKKKSNGPVSWLKSLFKW